MLTSLLKRWQRSPYNPFPSQPSGLERIQQLRQSAEAARLVLESEAYNRAYQILLARYGDQILETDPLDVEARENIFLKAHLLQEMVRELAGMVHAYEVELARQESGRHSP